MFDPPAMVAVRADPLQRERQPGARPTGARNRAQIHRAAEERGGTLPLSKSLKTIAVIGPNADSTEVLLGNYNGEPSQPVTPLAGIRRKAGPNTKVLYARGSDLAADMPTFETVPASALCISAVRIRQHGLKGEYFATSNFNGRAYIRASLRFGRDAQSSRHSVKPDAALHARGPADRFRLAGWRAAPRPERRQLRRALDRLSRAPVTGTYQIRRHRHECFRALPGRQACCRAGLHARARL